MRKFLFAYNISGTTINELESYNLSDLNGNQPLLVSDLNEISGYTNITSIENWFKYGDKMCSDYLQMRSRIKDELNIKHWSGCTSTEKDIIIETYNREENVTINQSNYDKIVYLMSVKGLSQSDATLLLQEAYSKYHIKEIESCLSRAQNEKLFKVIVKYLQINDAADFTRIITTPYHLFTTQAIRGVNDGEAGEGLFDFIESTVGTSYETAGLRQQGYTMANGDNNMDNFINELMDILRNGNY